MKAIIFILVLIMININSQTVELFEKLSNSHFRGMSIVNENVVWISGSNGTIMRTLDKGKSWVKINVYGYEKNDFRDIHAFDEQKAIIMSVGSPALFLVTENGGKTWNEVYRNEEKYIFFDSMEFWNDKDGIAFSDPINDVIFIVKTNDSGKNWYEVNSFNIPKANKGESAFAASGTCIAIINENKAAFVTGGNYSRLFFTDNKGETWDVSTPILINDKSTEGFYSIDFFDENNAIAVGGDYTKLNDSNNNYYTTSNGGKDWISPIKKPIGFKSCVKYSPINKNIIVVTGTSGTDITYDSGNNWTKIDSNSYNVLDFSKDGKTIFLAGDRGNLAKIELEGTK